MFSVRKAVYTDAETIATIHVNTWKSTYTDLLEERDLTNMTYENRKTLWETVLRLKKREQCTFVICDDEKIVGFISGGPERTKRFAYDGEIYTIYILDEYQKKGLGAKLLKAFAQEMKGMNYHSILVWVLKQNPSSRFYERYLAKSVGEEAITVGEGSYQETAYGWDSIDELLEILA
ncbi:GNAT family N-acetyltransferase [Virgibacillus alimentarius]|uniref:L-amino acid N-acyltransferase YncA n=1 Tax=Virgibacillus alimentarius TaxID=698769 RepID=A0ABS4SBS1_9BACI|nr:MULTISPECIES: GNAT family N-acetyltransferase [Virgibacillus]MBP2257842.1 L-amino acid N-acyltransferase YncA [Virgibacillus alimentarius]HLR66566.1 GNAT family N-acetyltransferase [Virgibacillus sp.]